MRAASGCIHRHGCSKAAAAVLLLLLLAALSGTDASTAPLRATTTRRLAQMNSNTPAAAGNAGGSNAASSPLPNTAAGSEAAGNAVTPTNTAAGNAAGGNAAGSTGNVVVPANTGSNTGGTTAGGTAGGSTAGGSTDGTTAGNTGSSTAGSTGGCTGEITAGNTAAGTTPGNTAAGDIAGNAAAGNTAAAAAAAFPGYPRSGGLLLPQLQPLLLAIQQAHLYYDSKTAVDLVLKRSPADTLAAFQQLQAANGTSSNTANTGNTGSGSSSSSVDRDALQALVNQTLDPAGSDLQQCVPSDWQQQQPNFLPNLTATAAAGGADSNGSQLLQFALDVHGLWRVLCRQVSPAVVQNPEQHSLLPLPNRTVVPGDRFRETYYWDSYWVVRGLLVSRMTQTAAGLIDNLMSMLEAVGHVPNGARVYYLNRSQPPLLSAMVRELYEAAPQQNPQLLSRALPLLLREHAYWTSPPKQVQILGDNGTVYNLSRYYANWQQPRHESYREDVETAVNATGSSHPSNPAAAALYRELASGAESGWDYSSRWFADGKTLGTIRTTQIVPADLNAFLHQMERNIAWAANKTGDAATSHAFNEAAAARKAAMQALLWDNTTGMWHDGILTPANTTSSSSSNAAAGGQLYTLTQNPGVFASNFIPLWAGLTEGDEAQGRQVVQALNSSGLVGPAGIATTLYPTGQQWDYPNGWPPLQHMLIEGASNYGGAPGGEFAGQLAHTWVNMNARVFNSTGHMHEKYDVSHPSGLVGRGGEYAPQVGFGWSNGVVLDFLSKYF